MPPEPQGTGTGRGRVIPSSFLGSFLPSARAGFGGWGRRDDRGKNSAGERVGRQAWCTEGEMMVVD